MAHLSQRFDSCEHLQPTNKDHFVCHLDDSYDLKYLEAIFTDDLDEIDSIEEAAYLSGYGPRVACTSVTNFSAQRPTCCMSNLFVDMHFFLTFNSHSLRSPQRR